MRKSPPNFIVCEPLIFVRVSRICLVLLLAIEEKTNLRTKPVILICGTMSYPAGGGVGRPVRPSAFAAPCAEIPKLLASWFELYPTRNSLMRVGVMVEFQATVKA